MQSMKRIIVDDLMKYKLNVIVEISQMEGELLDFRQSGPASQLVNPCLVTWLDLKQRKQDHVSCEKLLIPET